MSTTLDRPTIDECVVPRSPSAFGELRLPMSRGPLSEWLLARLRDDLVGDAPAVRNPDGFGEDLQLALYLCYELHFSQLPGVQDDLEWDPEIIAFRRALESTFEAELTRCVPRRVADRPLRELIPAIIDADDGPSLSRYMEHDGTIEQMREFVIHRSAYQLKEGDPHTFAIPRLDGRAKQILVEIQAGEYGADGFDRRMHSQLFAQTMQALGLDDRRHAYLDVLPASALAISNLIALFGLNRRWRGALVGHLSVFELTSVVPMGRYTAGLERMGASREARRFYDVHVLADAEHERLALDMVEALADAEPALVDDIVFGAGCVLEAERRFAGALLDRWSARASTPV